jgi:hypothetical protein
MRKIIIVLLCFKLELNARNQRPICLEPPPETPRHLNLLPPHQTHRQNPTKRQRSLVRLLSLQQAHPQQPPLLLVPKNPPTRQQLDGPRHLPPELTPHVLLLQHRLEQSQQRPIPHNLLRKAKCEYRRRENEDLLWL